MSESDLKFWDVIVLLSWLYDHTGPWSKYKFKIRVLYVTFKYHWVVLLLKRVKKYFYVIIAKREVVCSHYNFFDLPNNFFVEGFKSSESLWLMIKNQKFLNNNIFFFTQQSTYLYRKFATKQIFNSFVYYLVPDNEKKAVSSTFLLFFIFRDITCKTNNTYKTAIFLHQPLTIFWKFYVHESRENKYNNIVYHSKFSCKFDYILLQQ